MRSLSCTALLSVAALAVACATPPPAPAPTPVASAPKAAPPAPRCVAGAPDQPSDVRDKMRALGGDVQRCFLLGARRDGTRVVRAEVTISENGKVKHLEMTSPGADPTALECAKKSVAQTQFSTFCGDDVTAQWSYTAQQ